MRQRIVYIALWIFLGLPSTALADSPKTIEDIINNIIDSILNPLIYLLFAIATVIFTWGIINYVMGGEGDESRLKLGKNMIVWGLVGMFIMASAWGIVSILCDFFGTCDVLPADVQLLK